MFWGIPAELFIPCTLLIGATLIMFGYHAILYFQYKERVIWKYCFYLASISIYLLLDIYTRSDGTWLRAFQRDALSTAVNFIVILGYSSFIMEALTNIRKDFPRTFMAWSVVYYGTIAYILFLFGVSWFELSKLDPTIDIISNVLRVLFVIVGVIAIVQFYPLIKGRFMNLVKWGGMVYLCFMLLVLAAMFLPGRNLLGLGPMHYVYLGTFVDVLIFSYAMSLKIKESLNKAAELRHDLSRDLHDEVGATLTGIRVFGQLAKERPETQAVNLEKINSYSEEMLNKMSDIVWAINPDNDSIERMISKLHSYAASLTSAKNIQLDFKIDENIRKKSLDMNLRKNIYMLSKEAVNNAVKYADCKRIGLSLITGSKTGVLRIEDDGKGFNKEDSQNGNGLRNMQIRAEEVKGKLSIESQPGKGTVIELAFNFT